MTVLAIHQEPGRAFICGIEGWLQTSEEKMDWQQLVILVVQYAFESRPVTLITLSPVQWSLGYSLSNARELKTNHGHYLVNHIERSSRELLSDVAESEEFRRGLLGVSAADPTDETQLRYVVKQMDVGSPAPTASATEALLLLDDGRRIYWLDPGRDLEKLYQAIVKTSRAFGWELRTHEE